MNLRVPMLACALLWAQMPWAHAVSVAAPQAQPAHASPCHDAAHEMPPVDAAADATIDAVADGATHAPVHDCCGDPACDKAGCHCLCSTALILEGVSASPALALWTIGHVFVAFPAVPTARPPDLFRPPI